MFSLSVKICAESVLCARASIIDSPNNVKRLNEILKRRQQHQRWLCDVCRANLKAAAESDARLESRLVESEPEFSKLSIDAALAVMPRLQVPRSCPQRAHSVLVMRMLRIFQTQASPLSSLPSRTF
jgi:transposase-like protein